MKKIIFISLLFAIAISGANGQVNYSGTTVSGLNPSAIGTNTKAIGSSTFAAGVASEASAYYTTALGFYSFATYTKAISIGSAVKSNRYKSIVIGSGSYSENKYLENNVEESLMVGFNSRFPTLLVTKPMEQDFEFSKTGRIGIGNITNPLAKLHIKADADEDAAVFIEPRFWNEGERGMLGLGNIYHGISAEAGLGLFFHTQNSYIFNEGKVGINTKDPDYDLHVEGSLFTNQFIMRDGHIEPHEGFVMVSDDNGKGSWQDPTGFSLWSINPNNNTDLFYTDGNVGIGTIKTHGYRLAVNGSILTDEVMVKHPVTWHDYVFKPGYELRSLQELENFVKSNFHLPDIPPESQITDKGFSLGEMDGLLLKKIEELTLYIIEQEKRLDQQDEMIRDLQNKIVNN